jgi:hypothetical protein
MLVKLSGTNLFFGLMVLLCTSIMKFGWQKLFREIKLMNSVEDKVVEKKLS